MTNRISRIAKLLMPLNPSMLEIVDESYMHRGHAGVDSAYTETHLKIKIEADFENMKLLDKHRKVKALIKEEFENGLHAVSIEVR